MKKPEPAPSSENFLKNSKSFLKIIKETSASDVQEILERANTDYMYWDRFKQVFDSPRLEAEEAWAYLKFIRKAKAKWIPLISTAGIHLLGTRCFFKIFSGLRPKCIRQFIN